MEGIGFEANVFNHAARAVEMGGAERCDGLAVSVERFDCQKGRNFKASDVGANQDPDEDS